MAKLTVTGAGDAVVVAEFLKNELQDSAISCSLTESVSYQLGGAQLYVMVFDKYYMRANNCVSLTAVVTGENGRVTVDVIGSGGGQGSVFKLSWGAEEDFVSVAGKILARHGFSC